MVTHYPIGSTANDHYIISSGTATTNPTITWNTNNFTWKIIEDGPTKKSQAKKEIQTVTGAVRCSYCSEKTLRFAYCEEAGCYAFACERCFQAHWKPLHKENTKVKCHHCKKQKGPDRQEHYENAKIVSLLRRWGGFVCTKEPLVGAMLYTAYFFDEYHLNNRGYMDRSDGKIYFTVRKSDIDLFPEIATAYQPGDEIILNKNMLEKRK
jgi:hypothetical protein